MDSSEDSGDLSTTKPTNTPSNRWKDRFRYTPYLSAIHLDDSRKIGAAIAIVCYALGLLTVNMYLFQIGVSDFAILRTRFILTGALVLVFFLFLAIIIFSFVVWISDIREYRKKSELSEAQEKALLERYVGVGLLITATLVALRLVVFSGGPHKTVMDSIPIEVWALPLTLILPLLWYFEISEREGTATSSLLVLVAAMCSLVLSFFIFLVLIDAFAGLVYPRVPPQFGGGEPREVRLVVASESSSLLGMNGLNILETENVSKRLRLLWETDQMYVVQDADNRDASILQVDKDSIVGVIGKIDAPSFNFVGTPNATPVAPP